MSEDSAWEKFSSTGSVMDYLIYASIRNENNKKSKGVEIYANQYGRPDNNGKTNLGT